ncbi:MAG: hypothetical protein OEQ18_18275, partial [Gammaproteobacteria bacterium]|nr:hypothetical protein [Gammaproteobacteria bacterium]
MSDSGAAPAETQKVPFWGTIFESFRFVFTNLRYVVTIGWLPFIIIAAASNTGKYPQVYDDTFWLSQYYILKAAITIHSTIFSWVGHGLLAVCWHRFVILGEGRTAALLLARRNF